VLSVDLDEWYHSRRWVDGEQAQAIPDPKAVFRKLYGTDEPSGELIAPTMTLLALLRRYNVRVTFFVLGEVAQYYPDLVRRIAADGHEIASHGLHHVDMTVLGAQVLREHLEQSIERLRALTGRQPIGYRAPNLVYEPWATAVLEQLGFEYDASVCGSRPIGGKYRGWLGAPTYPYHPSYDNVAVPGTARLVEVPLAVFPFLKIAGGSSITTRVFGLQWARISIRSALGQGDAGYYLHPWELGHRPAVSGHWLRNTIFLRRTGEWMVRAVDRLLDEHASRIVTASEAAAGLAGVSGNARQAGMVEATPV
jgi:peptidoglycan/xylan/chitin deacetylase (PgdA/CDA1 family)